MFRFLCRKPDSQWKVTKLNKEMRPVKVNGFCTLKEGKKGEDEILPPATTFILGDHTVIG